MNHKQLLQEFTDWLLLLGYANATAYKLHKLLSEFFKKIEINKITELTSEHFYEFYKESKIRSNKRFGGGLSNKTLNEYQWSFRVFSNYITKYYKHEVTLNFKSEKVTSSIPIFLSVAEVKELFQGCNSLENPYKQRSKAILVLLYNCGLRRSEASKLNVQDIRFGSRVIHVEKGKNNKQRFVPFNQYSAELLREYLLDARMDLNQYNSPSFLLGATGHRLMMGTIGRTIKTLVELTGNKELQLKKVTAHTLRHSIATHLLEQGMDIESIQLFLGHSSLESTQLYTHIGQDNEL